MATARSRVENFRDPCNREERDQLLFDILNEFLEASTKQESIIASLQTQIDDLRRILGRGRSITAPVPVVRDTHANDNNNINSIVVGDPSRISSYTEDFEEWHWKIRARLAEAPLRTADERTKIRYIAGRTTGKVFDSILEYLPDPAEVGGRRRVGVTGNTLVRTAEELLEDLMTEYLNFMQDRRRR